MAETIVIRKTDEEVEIKVPCEVYSRIVGYLRPVQNWNKGKQQEFVDRQTFHVPQDDDK
ncbi:MAG TPA: anaerobic ribonucleoside-triphosphate reductase [Anaerolineae bacterium]|nr:anaerobic ribonucleoside-triphosphate reductase [Anaerolineae bacterium]